MKFTQRAFFIITLATSSLLGMSVEGRAQEPIEIRMASDFALSPDGETLVFRWANELWSTSIEPNGSIKRLTNHPAVDSQPRFSPNGKQIAFISNRSGSNQIYVMPAEGGIPQQKTFHSEGYSLADWFPDGNSVLAVASRDHFWRGSNRMMQIDLTKRSAEKMLLDDAAANPKLSNDGKKILFTREGERWWRKAAASVLHRFGCSICKAVQQANCSTKKLKACGPYGCQVEKVSILQKEPITDWICGDTGFPPMTNPQDNAKSWDFKMTRSPNQPFLATVRQSSFDTSLTPTFCIQAKMISPSN